MIKEKLSNGIYLREKEGRQVYRIWWSRKWYPIIFYNSKSAELEFYFLRKLRRNRFFVCTAIVVCIITSIFIIVEILR